MRAFETSIDVIGDTTDRGGLVVRARLDRRRHPTGKQVTKRDLRELTIERHDFRGDRHDVIGARTEMR